MLNVMKRVWKYEFSTLTQELFVGLIDDFYARHPEYRSYKKVAEMAGIDPALLTKLRKKNKTGEFGMKLRFLHLFPFLEKGMIDIEKLKLGSTDEEKWIMLLCDTCIDEKLIQLFDEAFRMGLNVPDIIFHKE